MSKQRVFVTGATGGMGFASLKEMLKDTDKHDIVILARDSEKNRELLRPYMDAMGLEIVWGDLNDYQTVLKCVKGCDLVLHIAAFVSPAADYHPKQAMKINYGSARNIINAIFELGQQDFTRLVYIGTVAETGDRMPPIHWGRVGDPIKPSMFDYYAVSKVAAERLVIESGLKYWVSLRQTGIIGRAMASIEDAIMFHNCFDNVLEYCSDRDSARAMKNLCAFHYDGTLDESFWGHIYNIGGGESCRVSTYEMYKIMYGAIGLTNLDYMLSPKKEATRNFHGHYYLDGDKLENFLHFRGGKLLSTEMKTGDWSGKPEFRCAFGHKFTASPRLVLEGGHWCDECERKSWNYGNRAKVDPFFAQVWNPLHDPDELREYPKEVSEQDV